MSQTRRVASRARHSGVERIRTQPRRARPRCLEHWARTSASRPRPRVAPISRPHRHHVRPRHGAQRHEVRDRRPDARRSRPRCGRAPDHRIYASYGWTASGGSTANWRSGVRILAARGRRALQRSRRDSSRVVMGRTRECASPRQRATSFFNARRARSLLNDAEDSVPAGDPGGRAGRRVLEPKFAGAPNHRQTLEYNQFREDHGVAPDGFVGMSDQAPCRQPTSLTNYAPSFAGRVHGNYGWRCWNVPAASMSEHRRSRDGMTNASTKDGGAKRRSGPAWVAGQRASGVNSARLNQSRAAAGRDSVMARGSRSRVHLLDCLRERRQLCCPRRGRQSESAFAWR